MNWVPNNSSQAFVFYVLLETECSIRIKYTHTVFELPCNRFKIYLMFASRFIGTFQSEMTDTHFRSLYLIVRAFGHCIKIRLKW